MSAQLANRKHWIRPKHLHPSTGLALIVSFDGLVPNKILAAARSHIHIMMGLGILMMLLFMHVQFGPFRKLKQAVASEDWPLAGTQIGRIRPVVAANLAMGLLAAAAGSGGRLLG